jgi:adenylate kinase
MIERLDWEVTLGRVILLTGSPASGKSSLRKGLLDAFEDVVGVDYGQELLAMKEEEGLKLTYEALRQHSATVIQRDHVFALDERVIARVQALRQNSTLVLDSHAVTRESYGFRAIPFSATQIQRLAPDDIIVLRCDPEITLARIQADGAGRRPVTIELAREHQTLQEAIALSYAIQAGCPIHIIDTTSKNQEEVLHEASSIISDLGAKPKEIARPNLA